MILFDCVIFDIDGTLANISHRKHFIASKPKNWKAFNEGMKDDKPVEEIIRLTRMFWHCDCSVLVVSGREETYRGVTEDWLRKHGVEWDELYMRPAKDYRADDIIKSELLDVIYHDGYTPNLVFDDRDRVVKMWRERGLICCQVAPGDF